MRADLSALRKAILHLLTVALVATSIVLAAPPPTAAAQVGGAIDDVFTVVAGETTALDVLGNDTGSVRGPLTITSIARQPSTGTVTINRDGSLIDFEAPAEFAGTSFIYEMTDSANVVTQATVTVNVDTTCRDITVTPAEGGDGLDAAIVSANRCPGAQTIFLERGIYETEVGFSAVEDDLTVTALDSSVKPQIVNLRRDTFATTFRVTAGATLSLSSLALFDNDGAASTYVHAQNATLFVDQVEITGRDATSTEPFTAAIWGDGAVLNVTRTTITNADASAIIGVNGTTLKAESLVITDPAWHGIDVDGLIDVTGAEISGAGRDGIKAGSGLRLTDARIWSAVDAAVSVSTAEVVEIATTTLGLDPDGVAGINRIGITGQGPISLTDVTIANSKEIAIQTVGTSTLSTTNTLITATDVGLSLSKTDWAAASTSVEAGSTDCVLFDSQLTDRGDNSDTDGSCFPVPNQSPVAVADVGSAIPGETINIDVIANDSDPDGDTLTITSQTSLAARVADDGVSITYSAPDDFSGETFDYTIDDGNAGTATASVTVDLVCADATLTEADGGPALAAAVEAANDCPGAQTILLEPGTYTLRRQLGIDDALTVQGVDPEQPAAIEIVPPNNFQTGYVFFVNEDAGTFVARNITTAGSEQVGFAYLEALDVTLDNVTFSGAGTDCRQGIPNAINAQGTTLMLTNSTITRSQCNAVIGVGADITVADSEISESAGSAISASDGLTTVQRSQFHHNGNSAIEVKGLDTSSELFVHESYLYSNRGGISSRAATTVTGSVIGMQPRDGGDVAAGNSDIGVDVFFADLTIERSTVSHNGAGIRAGNQTQWRTSIVDSTIESNTTYGISIGRNNSLAAASGTTISGNTPSCEFQDSASLTDGGGNTDDDGTCGFFVIPDTLVVNTGSPGTDTNPGDGICSIGSTLPNGEIECSLRAAIDESNALEGRQTVLVESGRHGVRASIPVTDSVTVRAQDPSNPPSIIVDRTSVIFIFSVTAEAGEFEAHDLVIPANSGTALGSFNGVDTVLSGIQYTGARGSCGISRANAITVVGGSMLLHDSVIVDASCSGVQAFAGASLTIEDTTITGTGGYNVRFENGPLEIVRSVMSGATGFGIDTRNATATIRETEVHGNGTDGIYATGEIVITDSFIGSYRNADGELVADGNGEAGIASHFGNLTLDNTVVEHNGSGVRSSSQSQWSTDITNSQINNNVGGGLRLGPFNSLVTVTNTEILGNSPACEVQRGTTINDGGGNTVDDDTCGFAIPSANLNVIDQVEGFGRRVLATIADSSTTSTAALSAVGGTATDGVDYEGLTVERTDGGWQVFATLLDNTAADGDRTLEIAVTLSDSTVYEGTVLLLDDDAANDQLPSPSVYVDECSERAQQLANGFGQSYDALLQQALTLPGFPLQPGSVTELFGLAPPTPPIDTLCSDVVHQGSELLHGALAYSAPIARREVASLSLGQVQTFNVLANDGHADGRPIRVIPKSVTVDGFVIEIAGDGTAQVSAESPGSTTVDYQVCAGDSCRTAQLTVQADTSPPPIVRPDWISVNGGEDRRLSSNGRGPIDATRNDAGEGPLTVASIESAIPAAAAGTLVGVALPENQLAPEMLTLTQTVCTAANACASANLYVLANPDDAPQAPRAFVALPASGAASVAPETDAATGNFEIPTEHVNDIIVANDAGQFLVSAAPGFRGHAAFLYETCTDDGSRCSWGVVDVIAQSGLVPVANGDVFSIDIRDLYFSGDAPGIAIDVIGPAGAGADAVHGGVPELDIIGSASIVNGEGVEVAVITAEPPAGVDGQSNSLWVVPTATGLSVDKSGASGTATYQLCVAGTDLCDTATTTVTLDVVPVGTVDQAVAVPLWRVDNSGLNPEGREPLFDAFVGDSTVIDRRNAFLLSVLSEYVYEELPGSQEAAFEDRFNAAFISSGLSNSKFYETLDTPLGLITDTQVLVTETEDAVLVVARGSESALDWINNFTFPPEQGIHAGFKAQADAVTVRVIADLEARPANKPIWFAGHSLGGAVAQILASRSPRQAQGVVTFGSPAPFAAGSNPTVPPTVRYVNTNDPVPSLLQELGYDHVGLEEWITAGATGCVTNGARPSGPHLNFSDHSMSRYMPRMLRLLSTQNQDDLLRRYVSFDWMKWDPASGSVCDAPMSVARQDVVGTWQWGIAPQASQSTKAEEFVAGSWIIELDDRLVEVPAGATDADAFTALAADVTWTVPDGRGDIVIDEAQSPADGVRWLYRPIAATGQPWEPSPFEDETVVISYAGCNPWTSTCGDGELTMTFVPATDATVDLTLYSAGPIDVTANDAPPLVGTLAPGATVTQGIRALDGEILSAGQTVNFIGGRAEISTDGQSVALDLNDSGVRPPITVIDYQTCAQITLAATSVRGIFESCAEDALWLFESDLPSLQAADITVGPCDAVLDPGADVSLTTSTSHRDLAGVGTQAAFPTSVEPVFDFLDIGVAYRWSANAEIITQLGVDAAGPYLGECSGLGVQLQADALISLPEVSVFDDLRVYAGGTGTFRISPTGVNRLDGNPVTAVTDTHAAMTVGANATVGPLSLDADVLIIGDHDGVRVVDTVIAGQLTMPGLGNTQGASRLDLAGTIDGSTITLTGAGTLDSQDLYLDGFAFENVAPSFTIDTATNQVSGTVTGNLVVDLLDIDIPIVFSFDGSSWTLAANLPATDIAIGDTPQLLQLDDVAFTIGAAGDTNDATVDLMIGFQASSGQILPNAGGAVIDAQGITGLITSSGFITLEAASITGEFAGFGLAITDAVFQIDSGKPEGLIAEFGRVAGQIGGDDAVSVVGVSIYADGEIDVQGVCIAPENLLPDKIGAVGLPIRIIEACVVTGDLVPSGVSLDDEFITVTAELVLDSLAALDPTVTIGDSVSTVEQTQPFDFSAVLVDDVNLQPWTLGPLDVAFGSTSEFGITTTGSFAVGGFVDGVYTGALDGSGALNIDLPGIGAGSFAATIAGDASIDDNGDHVLSIEASVEAAANATAAQDGFLSIDSLTADLVITAVTSLGANPTSTIEVTVIGMDGSGSLEVPDGQGGSIGSADVSVSIDDGIWDFNLDEASTKAGTAWVTITDAEGTIRIDTTTDLWSVDGGFGASASFDPGLAQPAAITIAADAAWDGTIFALDFAATDGSAVPAFAVEDLFAASTSTPVTVSGGIAIDTTTGQIQPADLALGFGPTTVTLFPNLPAFSATAAGLTGTADANGVVATADQISGGFASDTAEPYELLVGGPISLDLRPEEPVFFQASEATLGSGAAAITVFGLVVDKDGDIDFTGLCGANSNGLIGDTFGIAGLLPVRITKACIIAGANAPTGVPADATYVEISGSFDFNQIDELNPYVTIGDGPAGNTFTDVAAIRYNDGSWALWNVAPIVLGFGPTGAGGLTVAGEIALGGYGNEGFLPEVAGTASAAMDLPGVAVAGLGATFEGEFSTTPTTTTLAGSVTVFETTPPGQEPPPALVSLESLDAVADVSLVATMAESSDGQTIWALDPTIRLMSASGIGAVGLGPDGGEQFVRAELGVAYEAGIWEFTATGQAASAGDFDWFVASDFAGMMTIDASVAGRYEVDGAIRADVDVDFDGAGTGSPAVEVDASIGFGFADGILEAEISASNPTPQTFAIDGLIEVQGGLIELRGGAAFDTATGDLIDNALAVDLEASFARLFHTRGDDGYDVTISGIDATLSADGFGGVATGIAGEFGSELDSFGTANLATGAATLTIDPAATERYVIATVTGATITVESTETANSNGDDEQAPTIITVGAVAVNSDGSLDIGGACAENDEGLIGQTFGIAGALPFDVTQVCVLSGEGVPPEIQAVMGADQRYASVSGTFDLSGIAELNPSITIGAGANHNTATDVFSLAVLYSDPTLGGDGSVTPWDAGPLSMSFGPVTAGGVTAAGSMQVGGYVAGQFIPDISGTAAGVLDLPGAASGEFTGTIGGTVDPAGSISARVTLDAQAAAALPGDGAGFVSLDELFAELGVAIQATVDADGVWSTTYSLDLLQADAAGSIGLGSGDGDTVFGGDVIANYVPGKWIISATGAASTSSADWLGFAELSGSVDINLADGANPVVAGSLAAIASLDVGGDGSTSAAAIGATVLFETDGSLLSATFSGSSISPIDVTVEGLVAIDGVNFALDGAVDFDLETRTVERFDIGAEFDIGIATVFPDVDGFTVIAREISGAVNGEGLFLGVESIDGSFGSTELEVGPTQLTFRPGATSVYDVFSVGFAQLITNGVGAQVTDVVVRSDGSVSIGGFCLEGQPGIASQTFGVAGVLPFDITEACVLSEQAGTTVYSASGFFDLTLLAEALGPQAVVTGRVGASAVGSDVDDPGTTNRFTVEFVDDGTGLQPRNFGPFELEVSGVAAGPFEGSLGLYFGGYQDGVLAGSYQGTAPEVPTPLVGGSFDISLDVDAGDDAEIGAGIGADVSGHVVTVADVTTLHLDGQIAGSGTLLVDDFGIEIVDMGADFEMQVGFNPTTGAFTNPVVSFDDAGAKRLLLGLGFATLEAEGVDLFPVAPPNDPLPAGVENLVALESVAMTFTDKAAVLAGWGASVDDIRVQYSQAAGVQVCAGPNFATAFQSGGEPDLFGWMPLTISNASFEIPDPSPQGGCDSVFDRLGNFGEASIVASLTLGESDQWPISASVDGVGIEVALLVDYAEWLADGAQGTPPDFPITQLEGLAFGMAPTNFGPLTLGGQIGVGYIIDNSGRPVWYGRLGVAADWNNIGLTLDIGASQYGPMWATISTPFTIPLGPTGFTITGIGGGLAFDRPWPTMQVGCDQVPVDGEENPSETPDCANALDLVRADIFELKQVAPTTQAEIMALVESKAAEVGTALDGADLAQQIWAFLPKSITLNLHGTINHATGVFDGTVTLGGNIDVGDLRFPPAPAGGAELVPDFALLGKGELSFFGFEAGELGIMMDYENPIDPTFAVALGVPGDGTLASFFPGGATFGGTLETTGMYSVWYLIARELAVQLFETTTDLPGADTMFADLAVRIERDRNRPLAQLLLNGQDPAEINAKWVRDRILALIPDTTTLPTGGTAVEDQVLADLLVGGKVAEAFVTEVFDTLANGIPGGPLESPRPPAVDADETIAAFQTFVKDLLLETPANGQRLLDVALATMNPKLEIVGEAGLEVFGLPVGPQQGLRLAIDKQALTFDYNGSPLALLDPRFALLVQEDTTISFNAPWDLEGLILSSLGGEPLELPLDPFSGSWGAGFDSVGTVVGLPYAAAGFVSPADNETFVQERLEARPSQSLELEDDLDDVLLADGGMLFDLTMSIPDLFSDPAALADDLVAGGCFDNDFTDLAASMTDLNLDDVNLDKIDAADLNQLQECFVLLTKTKELGSAQLYTPNPGPALGAAFEGWAFDDGLPPEVRNQLINAFDGWYLRGEMEEFELFGFPVIDKSEDPNNGTFAITEEGVFWGVQTSPFLTAVDGVDGRYQVNMRLPFLSGEGEPLPVSFDVIDTAVGPAVVPTLGGSWTFKGDQIAGLMDTIGLENMASANGSVTLSAYTPGYDRSTADDDLRNTGGVRLSTTGPIDGSFGDLVSVEKDTNATASLTLTPPSSGNLVGADIAGQVAIDGDILLGNIALSDGTLGIAYTGGVAPVVTVDGGVDLGDLGRFTASGVINVNESTAELTLETDSLQLNDDISVAGTMKLESVGTTWQVVATGATLTVGAWRNFAVESITINSDGSFAIDELRIGDIGSTGDALFIDDFGLSVSFGPRTGLRGLLLGNLVISLDSDAAVEIDLAALDLGERRIPVSGTGAFGRSFTAELAGGSLDFGTATFSIGRTDSNVWYAELDATIDLDDIGIDGEIGIEDLRVDSTGAINGDATLDTSWPVEVSETLQITTIGQAGAESIPGGGAPGGGGGTTGGGAPGGPPLPTLPGRIIEFRIGGSYVRTDGTWFLDLDNLPQVKLGGGSQFESPVRLDNGAMAGQLLAGGGAQIGFSGDLTVIPLELTVSGAGELDSSTRTFTGTIGSELMRFGPLSLEGNIAVSASPSTWSIRFASGSTAQLDGWGSLTTENGTTIDGDGGFDIDLSFDQDVGAENDVVRIDSARLQASYEPGQELSVALDAAVQLAIDLPGSGKSFPCLLLGEATVPTGSTEKSCTTVSGDFNFDIPTGSNGAFSDTVTTNLQLGDWIFGNASITIERFGDGTLSVLVNGLTSISLLRSDYLGPTIPSGLDPFVGGTIELVDVGFVRRSTGETFISGSAIATLDVQLADFLPGLNWNGGVTMDIATRGPAFNRRLVLSIGDASIDSDGGFDLGILGSLFLDPPGHQLIVDTFPLFGTTQASFDIDVVDGFAAFGFNVTTVELVGCTVNDSVVTGTSSGSFTVELGEGNGKVVCTARQRAGNLSLATETLSFDIAVVRQPPIIQFDQPNDFTAYAASKVDRVVVQYPGFGVVNGTASCVPSSGSKLPVGATEVTCTASNTDGSTPVVRSFEVTVARLNVATGGVVYVDIGGPPVAEASYATIGLKPNFDDAPLDAFDVLERDDQGMAMVQQTDEVRATGSDSLPFSTTQAWLRSEPVDLGSTTVDADGSWTLDMLIPADVPVGSHTLILVSTTRDGIRRLDQVPLEVIARSSARVPVAPRPTTPSDPVVSLDSPPPAAAVVVTIDDSTPTSQPLAHTGSMTRLPALLGLSLMGFGALMLGCGRSRRHRIRKSVG